MSDSPERRIEQACQRFGRPQVVRRCLSLLSGESGDPDFVVMLGGAHAMRLLDDGVPRGQAYWLRVWAARGLLWAGPGDDIDVLGVALDDESWRVREMTCKVAARHRVGELLEEISALRDDPVRRVRDAAARAALRIVETGA